MLLPALGKVKSTAYAASCLNLFGQFGKSAMMYSDDNDGYTLPYRNDYNTVSTGFKYAIGVEPSKWLLRPYMKPKGSSSIGKLTKNKTPNEMECPARRFDLTLGASATEYTFGINYSLAGKNKPKKLVRCQQPSGTSVLAEVQSTSAPQFGATGRVLWFVQHQGKANVAYLDAHAAPLRQAEKPKLESFPFYNHKP